MQKERLQAFAGKKITNVPLDSFDAQNISCSLTIHELWASNLQADIGQNLIFYNYLDLIYCSSNV